MHDDITIERKLLVGCVVEKLEYIRDHYRFGNVYTASKDAIALILALDRCIDELQAVVKGDNEKDGDVDA